MTCWREDVNSDKSDPPVKHLGGQPTNANEEPVPPNLSWESWSSGDWYNPPIDYHDQQIKYKQELREYNEKLEKWNRSHT
jgi:hypothetical protein